VRHSVSAWDTARDTPDTAHTVGPIIAMFPTHLFSAAMAKHVEAGRVSLGVNGRKQFEHRSISADPLAMSYDSAALQDVVQALDDAAIVGRVRPRFPVLGG